MREFTMFERGALTHGNGELARNAAGRDDATQISQHRVLCRHRRSTRDAKQSETEASHLVLAFDASEGMHKRSE